jgi:hypothetical protein
MAILYRITEVMPIVQLKLLNDWNGLNVSSGPARLTVICYTR